MANVHTTLTSLFDDIADAIRENTPVTEHIKADAFPAYIRMLGYDGTIPATPSVLNSCSWDFIRWASDEGIADLLWSIGDRKAVSIGAWGAPNTNYGVKAGTYYCYIIGFNHNSGVEGNNKTHFEFGFNARDGGTHIGLTGSDYGLTWSSSSNTYFLRMNYEKSNAGGWESSDMRTGALNGSNRSFKLAVPSDLRNVIKSVTKYTDNTGGGKGNIQSNVTATTDTFFILNMEEVYGNTNTSNSFEANYTKQYQYYKNGNPKLRYRSDAITSPCYTFLRSPVSNNSTNFGGIGGAEGYYASLTANACYAVSPAFCV